MESGKRVLMNLSAGTEMQMQGLDLWAQCGEQRAGHIGRAALTYTH